MFTFVIKASTPEAMRDEVIKWLNHQASNHSVAAKIASRKGTQHTELAKSQAYGDAAKFLEGCTVENTSIKYVETFAVDDGWKFTDSCFISITYDTLSEVTAQAKAYADNKNLEFKY